MQDKIQMKITTNTVFKGEIPVGAVTSVNQKTGDVVLGADDIDFEDGQNFQQKYDNGQLKGEKGDQGLQGDQGLKGDKGDQGEQGLKGDKGDQGEQGIQGNKGEDGQSATVQVGTVTTGEAGTQAIVTNRGTESNAIFDFTIPKGEDGQSASGGIEEAPKDSKTYGRNNGAWSEVTSGGDSYDDTEVRQLIAQNASDIESNTQAIEAIEIPDVSGLASKQEVTEGLATKQPTGDYATTAQLSDKLDKTTVATQTTLGLVKVWVVGTVGYISTE